MTNEHEVQVMDNESINKIGIISKAVTNGNKINESRMWVDKEWILRYDI